MSTITPKCFIGLALRLSIDFGPTIMFFGKSGASYAYCILHLGRLLAFHSKTRGTSTLAYFVVATMMEKESFMKFIIGSIFIKLFPHQ